ncbi:Protein slit like protein [Argiope bruennichi]|uniref:Protein slit like protein n=1 Tax=Argiope bruennichi TaxID=94029 RepID=A0A8T0FUV5_ARGBR|nr:Protein slit like protein [Argiope bruennichi]
MIFLFLSFALLSSTLGCLWETIPPCSCRTIGFHTTEITCTDANNVDTLRSSLSRVKDMPIQTLYIMDSSLLYIPSDVFLGLRVERIWLDNSTFRDLSDSEFAFEGLSNSLRKLFIQDCIIFNGFQWHEFKKLENLTSLMTVKAGLNAIDSDISEIAHLPLANLELTQDSISYIDENAFTLFENLAILSLKRNLIKDVARSMLPNPATKLNVINLSFNLIERLPEDMFTNMPALTTIILSANKLITVDFNTFSPVWSRLNKIDLYENPMRCDCRMTWIFGRPFPKNVWAVCWSPSNLNGTTITDIRKEELYC